MNVDMQVEELVGAEVKGSAQSTRTAYPDAELPPTVAEWQKRVVAMVTDASNVLCDSGVPPVTCDSTHEALGGAIQAVNNVFDQRRNELCCSPERSDLTISKEEGLGWVIADAFNCELLVAEARGLGKRVGKQLSVTVKKEKEAVASAAKTARSEARKAAKKDTDLAVMLDAEIRRIDTDADVQRATIDAHVYDLKLPKGKIVTSKVKPAPPPREEPLEQDEDDPEFQHEVDLLARRRTVLEQANENGRASSKALVEFRREFDKLEAAMERERKPKLKKVTRHPVAEDEVGVKQAFQYFADSGDALRSYQEALLTYEQRQSSLELQRAHLARLQDAVTRACRDFDVAMEEYELQR